MTDDHWATVELTAEDRDRLQEGETVARIIEQGEQSVDLLELEWWSKGVIPPVTLEEGRPEAVNHPPLRTDEKPLDEVYRDRNLLACALAASLGGMAGYAPDPESPEEWGIVFAETPYGQVSWHVPMELIERLGISRREDYEWDGHDRERKNDILASWTQDGCPR